MPITRQAKIHSAPPMSCLSLAACLRVQTVLDQAQTDNLSHESLSVTDRLRLSGKPSNLSGSPTSVTSFVTFNQLAAEGTIASNNTSSRKLLRPRQTAPAGSDKGALPSEGKGYRSNPVGCVIRSIILPGRTDVSESKTHHKLTKNPKRARSGKGHGNFTMKAGRPTVRGRSKRDRI
jgi:hypothetical protein